jgi:hypothetical protein
VKNFCEFNESYLQSNFAPIYHLTNEYYLLEIISSNKILKGWIDNPFKEKKIKIVSLTRNPRMRLKFKDDSTVIIELDKNKMINKGYKFLPYDFFIHSKKENKPKSSLDRKEPFEFEECVLSDIKDVKDYIISVNLPSNSFYDPSILNCIKDLKSKNIKVLKNGIEF